MSKAQIIGEVVKEYLEAYPKYPTRTLAKMIFKENSQLGNVESIRDCLRHWRGNHGKSINEITDKRFVSNASERMSYHQIPAEIPESDSEAYIPYDLADGKWLVMSDIHVPYHDVEAVRIAVKHGKKNKVNGILLLGDCLDSFQLSKFAKDPRKRNTKGELDAMNGLINYFEKELKCKIVFKLGNHEARLEMYLYTQAPALLGVTDYQFSDLLYAPERGMDMVREEQIIKCGHLTLLHGHEYRNGFSSPVNPARGMFLKASACTLSGHEHRTSQNSAQTINGTNISNWSLGTMSELHPKYRPLSNWNLGFAIVDKKGKDFDVSNLRIIHGVVV